MIPTDTRTPWRCRACVEEEAGCNLPAHLGLWGDPPNADATCATCGDPPSDAVRLRLLLARSVEALTRREARPAPAAARRASVAPGILSARSAAARLGVNRSTLGRMKEQGLITTVPKGGRLGYRAADVEALVASGFTLDGPIPRPPPRKTPRRPSRRKSAADPSIEARLAKF